MQVFRGYGAKLLQRRGRGELLLLRHGGGHYAGLRPVGHGHRLQRDGGRSKAVHGEDLTIAPVIRGADAAEYVSDPVCAKAITTVTEWKRIHTKAVKKALYAFTFPLFMFTYIPISFAALFSKGEWKPIEHRVSAASLRAGPGGAAALLTGSLPPVQSEK